MSIGRTTKRLPERHTGATHARIKEKTGGNYEDTFSLDEPRLGSTTRFSLRQAKALGDAERDSISDFSPQGRVKLGLTTTRLSQRQVSAGAVRESGAPTTSNISCKAPS